MLEGVVWGGSGGFGRHGFIRGGGRRERGSSFTSRGKPKRWDLRGGWPPNLKGFGLDSQKGIIKRKHCSPTYLLFPPSKVTDSIILVLSHPILILLIHPAHEIRQATFSFPQPLLEISHLFGDGRHVGLGSRYETKQFGGWGRTSTSIGMLLWTQA